VIEEAWYLIYEGSSPDGRGSPAFSYRTTDRARALNSLKEMRDNPYSNGYVIMVTDEESTDLSWNK
jgi:hypothetical protein